MIYKVIPFIVHTDHKTGYSNHVSLQLEQLINKYSEQGWTYLKIETVTNHVQGKKGCLGFGAKPGFTLVSNMLVFKK
ncbi:hypothetical protein [Aequorivita antarctica]|uniref:DUF4177 domain-containing protein n=1 Tax=Aequorivita antarctica TaxID=153266 RepID=A0A5C6Z1C9_9FLAO|nr:hypothetical protein [Aequorivita antarctica]TXD73827.1 hypothetical protein ESU54_04975 [Aequorivita antarctica]SRX73459.1 hypothetical protein AEQU3_00897 [Aequorivita antarctica]